MTEDLEAKLAAAQEREKDLLAWIAEMTPLLERCDKLLWERWPDLTARIREVQTPRRAMLIREVLDAAVYWRVHVGSSSRLMDAIDAYTTPPPPPTGAAA